MTENARTVTVAIEHDAAPESAAAVLADLTRLPEWAPAFAERAEHRGGAMWTISARGEEFDVTVDTDERAGTVDLLRPSPTGGTTGARFRAMPRPGGGSVVTMTMPTFSDDLDANRAAAQTEIQAFARLLDPPAR